MNLSIDSQERPIRFIIGIDLGTTNSAVAYIDRSAGGSGNRKIRFLRIPQITAAGEVGSRSILPSFLYIPGPYELPAGSIALPWAPERDYAVGEFAREQGALVPGRLVSSAKSWLCHGGVDRTAPILPWGAVEEVQKVSPVEASCRYLKHMREAWDAVMAAGSEELRMEEQLVILTVPASFDEVARELTVSAAREAGLKQFILLEEPLAAFYAWLSRNEERWEGMMRPGQLILVCDVGGGTTDFTVVTTRQGEGGLILDRLAVGDHLMLGGDNMDLALARQLELELFGKTGQLDSRRWHQLWHQCRKAKETLLGTSVLSPEKSSSLDSALDITVMGSGGRLIGDAKKATLTRSRVESTILEGFFPCVSLDSVPQGTRRTGLTEWGLPYVQDAAITRHLAHFWQRFGCLLKNETGRHAVYPDFMLFNGGALTPSSIRRRILSVVCAWFAEEAGERWKPVELENPRPELAVAVGAAYYGMVRMGAGVRVGAGSPRTYYVEVGGRQEGEESPGQRTAVCLVPRGTEEGFQTELTQPAFQVLANQPVVFQLVSSSTRLGDALGAVVTLTEAEISPLPPIHTVLRYGKKASAQNLPVQIATRLTEVGTLELWCHSLQSPHRWRLQFDVRQEGDREEDAARLAGETLDADSIETARERIRAVFKRAAGEPAASPEKLSKELVSALDMGRDKWPMPLIRTLSDTLLECRAGASLTAAHEARWLNLLGFCMRPGFGDPVDAWRIKELWKIFPAGLHFPRQPQGRLEWWILWRRVAGGLSAGQQLHIFQQMFPTLHSTDKKKKKPSKQLARTMGVQEETEICMTLAAMERLPVVHKVELGRMLLEKVRKGKPRPQELWAICRLGARVPFYGPLDRVIPRQEATAWIQTLLSLNIDPSDSLASSVVQLGRMTGDRERDLPPEAHQRIVHWLETLPGGARFVEILTRPEATLQNGEKEWIFGETLPAGLILDG
ncbi:MAG: hsp70 family protein [Deltaproteobacteria bacterium]|nr:hsp70 family protein [Deltaproteobacteria bacterium]